MDYCESLNSDKNQLLGYQLALATAIGGDPGLRQKYRAGEFTFVGGSGVSGGGSMNETFYGEAFVPRTYVEDRFANAFELIDFKPVGETYDQALFVLRKRLG